MDTSLSASSTSLKRLARFPAGSGNEKGISDYLVAFAKDRGLEVYQDSVYNVIIKKGGSAGAEHAEPVMMQGHLDMVCDKLAGVEHDFERDGIELVVTDGVLTANGTTLGADNGVAVGVYDGGSRRRHTCASAA